MVMSGRQLLMMKSLSAIPRHGIYKLLFNHLAILVKQRRSIHVTMLDISRIDFFSTNEMTPYGLPHIMPAETAATIAEEPTSMQLSDKLPSLLILSGVSQCSCQQKSV